MVAAKEWTMKDPKDSKNIALITRIYKLDKNKTSILTTF